MTTHYGRNSKILNSKKEKAKIANEVKYQK